MYSLFQAGTSATDLAKYFFRTIILLLRATTAVAEINLTQQITRLFIHSFIPAISIAPLQDLYYAEALPTTAQLLYGSFTPKRTGDCRCRTCPRSLRGG